VFSGVARGGAVGPGELSPALATIAQAFFERGVRTTWERMPVDDAQALTMADRFYTNLLQRQTPAMRFASPTQTNLRREA
jgi:hypothetical protein